VHTAPVMVITATERLVQMDDDAQFPDRKNGQKT